MQTNTKGASMPTLPNTRLNDRLVRWATGCGCAGALLALVGCAHIPNQFREDGPAAVEELESPSSIDLYARFKPNTQRHREWQQTCTRQENGAVTHWPLYFEDPFVDKGTGRKGRDCYHLGWEDAVATPYCFARFTLNWIAIPVSLVVQPPVMVMESDGVLSKQLLGYDHDATSYVEHPVGCESQKAEPAAR